MKFNGPKAYWKLTSRVSTLVLLKCQISLSEERDLVETLPQKLPIRPF